MSTFKSSLRVWHCLLLNVTFSLLCIPASSLASAEKVFLSFAEDVVGIEDHVRWDTSYVDRNCSQAPLTGYGKRALHWGRRTRKARFGLLSRTRSGRKKWVATPHRNGSGSSYAGWERRCRSPGKFVPLLCPKVLEKTTAAAKGSRQQPGMCPWPA